MHCVGRIDQHPDASRLRRDLMQQVQRLRHNAARNDGGHSGQVPAGPGEAHDEPRLNRVGNGNHYDRDRRRSVLDGPIRLGARRDDQIRSKRDQLVGERWQLVGLTVCVAALDVQVLALDVATLTQFLVESLLVGALRSGGAISSTAIRYTFADPCADASSGIKKMPATTASRIRNPRLFIAIRRRTPCRVCITGSPRPRAAGSVAAR